MVKDINPGVNDSRPAGFVVFENQVFFSAADTSYQEAGSWVYNTELFSTDGTEAGTTMVKDINQNSETGSQVDDLMVYNNTLFFTAIDFEHGWELWKSNGTSAGTQILKDINPGTGHAFPRHFCQTANGIYFSAGDGEQYGQELWFTQGSDETTHMIADLEPGYSSSIPAKLTLVDSVLLILKLRTHTEK